MIALGADHGGYELKEEIKKHLEAKGVAFVDCGTFSPASTDYPIWAKKVCDEIVAGRAEKGILCCGTGIGISMAANKVKGIRAACCGDHFSAKYTRLHNDANVLCMGGRVLGVGLALELVDVFLETEFEGGERHRRRIELLHSLEEQ